MTNNYQLYQALDATEGNYNFQIINRCPEFEVNTTRRIHTC
jgi:hypothetical protein